jgi:molecular chaperone HtpG
LLGGGTPKIQKNKEQETNNKKPRTKKVSFCHQKLSGTVFERGLPTKKFLLCKEVISMYRPKTFFRLSRNSCTLIRIFFLRELVSNAVDATQKLKMLSKKGEATGDLGSINIEILIDKDAKTLTIKDRGIGMTAEEIDKYINQIAFSSAEEFVEKFKGLDDKAQIIGHFGLGFYSAFMVAQRVDIITKSYKDAPAAKWSCDGSPEFTIEEHDKNERGTEIVLHIAEDATEFLDEWKIRELLEKYCKFLPIPIVFGEESYETETDEKDNEGKPVMKTEKRPRVINNTNPAWTRPPSELKDEDYLAFYRELYPMAEDPLFWIHLNVDFPFTLTGILYFPKLKKSFEVQKNKNRIVQ